MFSRGLIGVLVASLTTGILAGCTRADSSNSDSALPTAFRAVPITPVHQRASCELIPAQEMSRLLGAAVSAQSQRVPGACTYSPVSGGLGPRAELRIDLGDGETAMTGAGFVADKEPGAADPLAGLGDQAVAAGPLVLIRRGKDLISITVSGVDDELSRVKSIYAFVDSRM